MNSDVQSFIETSRNTKQVHLLFESASLTPADRREKANVKGEKHAILAFTPTIWIICGCFTNMSSECCGCREKHPFVYVYRRTCCCCGKHKQRRHTALDDSNTRLVLCRDTDVIWEGVKRGILQFSIDPYLAWGTSRKSKPFNPLLICFKSGHANKNQTFLVLYLEENHSMKKNFSQ